MIALSLKSIRARRLRTALTALAIVLGVALMAGSYLLTDTINASFDDIFTENYRDVDVAVVPRKAVESTHGAPPPPFSAELLERVRRVPGVELAIGGIFDRVSILGDDGEPLGSGGTPSFATAAQDERVDPYTYVDGRAPASDGEVAIDSFTSEREDFRLGETLRVGGQGPARSYRIVGVVKLGEVSSFGGASLAVMTLAEAQRVTAKLGRLDEISIAAAEGTSAPALKRAVRRALPAAVEVRTGEESAQAQSADTADNFGFLRIILLVFAGIALFVGGFIIFNTFSITVTQRTREFGMLRTLGASRAQLLLSVVIEAAVIGLVASAVGVVAGLGFAGLINGLFKAVGIDLPNTGTVVLPRTVVVSLLVGSLVTVVAALAPALRATRVSPMEAMREIGTSPAWRRRRLLTALALGLGALGVGLLCLGLFGGIESAGTASGVVGAGAVAIFLGVALFSGRLVRPIAALVGRPLERLPGVAGRLARENATRNPGRTAVTAAALMIGLALVTFVTVFAAGISSSVDQTIDRSFAGDLTLQNRDGFSPISAQAKEAVGAVEGVRAVSALRFSEARVEGHSGSRFMTGIDPRTWPAVFKLEWKEGSDAVLDRFGDRDAVVDEGWARESGIDVGERLEVTTPTGAREAFTVRGTVRDNTDLLGDFVVTNRAIAADFGERRDGVVLVGLAPGADVAAVRREVDRMLKDRYPAVESLNQKELKDNQAEQIDQVLGFIYALLSLAVIVSLFGIVNTLALSIHERTRELGMLRAIGMSRRQVRRIVRYESVITALIGALLGSILGVFFAGVVSRPLADEGFTFELPLATLLVLLLLAAAAGVLAAVLPARRASRTDILEALAYE